MKKMKVPEGLDPAEFAAMMTARGCEVKTKLDKAGVMAVWVGTCVIKPKATP